MCPVSILFAIPRNILIKVRKKVKRLQFIHRNVQRVKTVKAVIKFAKYVCEVYNVQRIYKRYYKGKYPVIMFTENRELITFIVSPCILFT